MNLSIVIIGLNEGPLLTDCFQSVKAMNFPSDKFELIYVDSASTDDSIERAKNAGAQVLVVEDSHPNAAKGRNLGWRHAKYEFILFLDGDTTVHPDFLSKALPVFKNPKVGIVFGKIREKHPHDSYYNRVHDIDWQFPIGEVSTCGGNTLMRMEVLKKINGFNESLSVGEEPELCQRVIESGFTVQSLNIPMVTHNININSFKEYWTRCKRTGYAYASIVEVTKNASSPLWFDRSRKNAAKSIAFFLWLGFSFYFLVVKSKGMSLMLLGAAILFLVGRTAWKQKNRGSEWLTSLYYGIHSHFQHIPMFCGQCEFWVSKIKKS